MTDSALIFVVAAAEAAKQPGHPSVFLYGPGALISVLLVIAAVLQIIIAPTIASQKGRDSALWFMVTLFWVVLFAGIWVIVGSVALLAVAATDSPHARLLLIALALLCIFVSLAPLFAAMFSSDLSGTVRASSGAYSRPRRTRGAYRAKHAGRRRR